MRFDHRRRLHLPRSRRARAVLTVIAALGLAAGITVPAMAETATGTITGSLTDDGTPVPYTGVELHSTDDGYIDYVTTDDNGSFTFADVPPDDYRLVFYLPGFTSQFWPQQTTQDGAGIITVAQGGVVTIDETVAPHGSITGMVTNSDGSPAVNQQVLAIRDGFDIVSQGTTDPDGNYHLPFVWPGTYIIEFGGFGAPEQWAHQKTNRDDADTFEVLAGSTLVVDEQLLPTGAIAGQLTDANGEPVAYASVSVFNDITSIHASTEFDGTYRIQVRPGVYKVRFSTGDLEQYAHQKPTETTADEFVVEVGEDTIVDEQLLASGTITGTLRDASGEPVPDASVYLYADGDEFIAFATTDDAGGFSIEALPGTYRLTFETRFGTQHSHSKSDPRDADPITVIGGETIVVDETLVPTGTITVTAHDSRTKKPLLEFCARPTDLSDVCTDTGTVVVELLPGIYFLDVSPVDPSYVVSDQTRVQVASNSNVDLAFDVEQGATMTTVVRDAATGEPVEGACIELLQPNRHVRHGPGGGFECSDADGLVNMTSVFPGTYNAWVRYFGGEYGNQWVGWQGGTGVQAKARLIIARSGATTRLPDILLDPPGSISGVVTDADTGEPLADTFVSTSSWSSGVGPGDGVVLTDSDGRYTLDGLGPYEWTLQFRHNDYASHFSGGTANRILSDTVPVRSGETTTHDTEMRRGTTVTGYVSLAPGRNADFVRITAYHALTGDELGSVDPAIGGTYSLQITGPTVIRLQYDASDGHDFVSGWYDQEATFREADIVFVPGSGAKTVDITIANLSP